MKTQNKKQTKKQSRKESAAQQQPTGIMRLFILFIFAKLGFGRLAEGKKVPKALSVAGAVSSNPFFPTTNPTSAEVTLAANAFLAALKDAESGDHEMVAIKNEKKAVLDGLMRQLQLDISSQSNGDPVKILSANMELSSQGSPLGKLGPVSSLSAKNTFTPGQADLKWLGVPKVKGYVVMMAMNNPMMMNWEFVANTTKGKLLVEGLQSGQTYLFRVACVSAAGVGDWSDTVACKIL
jgi:hypothetical protein